MRTERFGHGTERFVLEWNAESFQWFSVGKEQRIYCSSTLQGVYRFSFPSYVIYEIFFSDGPPIPPPATTITTTPGTTHNVARAVITIRWSLF